MPNFKQNETYKRLVNDPIKEVPNRESGRSKNESTNRQAAPSHISHEGRADYERRGLEIEPVEFMKKKSSHLDKYPPPMTRSPSQGLIMKWPDDPTPQDEQATKTEQLTEAEKKRQQRALAFERKLEVTQSLVVTNKGDGTKEHP